MCNANWRQFYFIKLVKENQTQFWFFLWWHFFSYDGYFCYCSVLWANLASSGSLKRLRRVKGWGRSVAETRQWKERDRRKVFLHEMCLLGNSAKTSLHSFSFRDEKKPSCFSFLILQVIFYYWSYYITSPLSSEADPAEPLSLHWWIKRLLWADLAGGAPSCTLSETRKLHGLELGSSDIFPLHSTYVCHSYVLSWRSTGTSKVNLILFVRTFGYKHRPSATLIVGSCGLCSWEKSQDGVDGNWKEEVSNEKNL